MLYLREKCVACGACVETCYAGATVLAGREMTVEQVMDEVLQDRDFYRTSGGGVTLSGGEPTIQRAFSRAILERCKAEGLHTAIETAGNCRWEDLTALLPVTDLVMMDLKHLDPGKHHVATGVSNRRILAHARRLVETDKPIIFRVPVVPTVNDTEEEVGAIADFVRHLTDLRSENGRKASPLSLELLPFHRLAGDKYRSLGLAYSAGPLDPLAKEKMAEFVEVVKTRGVTVHDR
jgi:pyruvate formate lyase activating enzyme